MAAAKSITVEPGKHIGPDSGLSDDFVITTLDDDGNAVTFRLEPREWLEEWEIVSKANLPPGAGYERLLLISAVRFQVQIRQSADWQRHYRFTIFDIPTRSDRIVTFAEDEVILLAAEIRAGLGS